MTRTITKALVLSTVVIWIGWDIYAAAWGGHGITESEVIRDWQLIFPALAFGIGVVFGHLTLWRETRIVGEGARGPVMLGVVSCAVVIFALLVDVTWRWIPWLAIAGAGAGHIFWSQKPVHTRDG